MSNIARIIHFLKKFLRIKLIGEMSIYVIGNLLQRAASFLLVPLYTRYLSLEDYGIWGTLVSIITVLNILLDMGVSSAVIRYYYDYFERSSRIKSYLITNFLFRMVIGGTLLVVIYFVAAPLWGFLVAGSVPFDPYVPIVLGIVYGELLAVFVTSVYRAQQRASYFIIAKLGQTLLQIVSSIYFVVILKQGALAPLYGQLLGASVVAIVLSVTFIYENFTLQIRWRDLSDSLSYGIPLIPHQLAGWVRNSADKVILIRFISLAALGIYNLGYSAGLVMSILVTSIDFAYSPYYYRLMKTRYNAREIVAMLGSVYVAGMGALCLLGALFANEIIHVLVPPSYYQVVKVIPLVLMSYFLLGQYTQCVKPLFYHKKTKLIPWLTGIPALLCIGLTFVLAPIWGIWAALWITFGTFFLTLIGVYVASNRIDPIRYPVKSILVLNGIVLAGVLLATYVFPIEVVHSLILVKFLYFCIYSFVAMLLVLPYFPLLRAALITKPEYSIIFDSITN